MESGQYGVFGNERCGTIGGILEIYVFSVRELANERFRGFEAFVTSGIVFC